MDDGYLYHYTGAHALLGMVRSRAIWASDSEYLNDGLEGKIVTNRIRHIANSDRGDMSTRYRDVLLESLSFGKVFLLASFSRRPNMLTQFRMYAPPRGGFVIGFPSEYLAQAGQLLPVIYEATEIEKLCEDYCRRFASAAEKIDDGRSAPSDLAYRLLRDRTWLDERCEMSIRCKSSEFSTEEEVRLLKWGIAPTHLRPSPQGHLLIPYTEIDLPNVDVEVRVGVGPGPSRQLAQRSLSWLTSACKESGTRWKISVQYSDEFAFREI